MTYASGSGQSNINLSGAEDLVISVKNFGAIGDGVADDTVAIQAALDAAGRQGGGTVYFPEGTYKVTAQLDLPTIVDIVGEGESSVIDFSSGDIADYPDACMYATGSLISIPTIGANIDQYDISATLASAPTSTTLGEDDVIILENTTNASFNAAEPQFHAGEFFRLVSASGTTVNFDAPSFAAYTVGANISIWKLNPTIISISKIKVIGPGETSPVSNIIRVELGRGITIKNLAVSGANHSLISIGRCYDSIIEDIRGFDFSAAVGLNYGIQIANSQNVIVSNCQITTTRHAITLGGDQSDGAVPCREILIEQSELGSTTLYGIGLHGNSEYVNIDDCQIPGGVIIAGDQITMSDCTVWAVPDNGIAVVLTSLIGPNIQLYNNEFIATANITAGSPNLVQWNDGGSPSTTMTRSGCFRLIGNVFTLGQFTGGASVFYNRMNQQNIDFEASNNLISQDAAAISSASSFSVRGDVAGDFVWRNIAFYNNECIHHSLFAYDTGSKLMIFDGNSVYASGQDNIRADVAGPVNPWDSEDVIIQNNYSDLAQQECILVIGNSSKTNMKISGNTALRGGQSGAGTSDERTSLTVTNAAFMDFQGNTLGDDQAAPTQLRLWSFDQIDFLTNFNNLNIGSITTVNETNITKKVAYVYSPTNQSVSFGTAPPAAGAWLQGDICWNTAPAAGGTPGWVCTTGGTPGTWKAMASVAV